MSPAAATAFQNASGQPPAAVALVFASIVIVFALLWLARLASDLFAQWQGRRLDWGDFLQYLVRGTLVLSLLLYFVS